MSHGEPKRARRRKRPIQPRNTYPACRGSPLLGASCAGSSTVVETPVDLVVTVFDVDERQLPNTHSIQSEIRLSASGSGATLPSFRLNGTPQTINGVQADVTLTAVVSPVPPAFGSPTLKLSRSMIDPALTDSTIASSTIVMADAPGVTYPSGARVRFSVQSPNGAVTQISEGVVPPSGFNLDWDARINGQPAPPGTYQLRTTLVASEATISAPVTVASVPSAFEIRAVSSDPWNPGAGPAPYSYRLSPSGTISRRVEGPSAPGSACTLGPQPVVVPEGSGGLLNAGNGMITVPMTTPAGRILPAGNYCVRFRAKDTTGRLIGTQALELNLSEPPPLRLVAALDPAVPWILPTTTAPDAEGTPVPVPAAPVFVEVRAVDDRGRSRPTGRITVRAVPFLIVPVPSALITTLTCTGVSVCRMRIGTATLSSTDVIFDADGADVSSTSAADPPPKTASAPQRAAALTWAPQNRAGPVSVPVIGSVGSGFNNVEHSRTQDVAFHVGTGLDLSVLAEATQVSDEIARILNVFFGGDSGVGATSVNNDGGRSVAFWLTRKPAVVDTEASSPGAPDLPLCRRSQMESVSFADIQAVIHKVSCRDNADWNHASFSTEWGEELGRVAWHEFHHAAYDLADEYPPDGAYYQDPTLPNVMSNANQCAQFGAEPNLCAQIGTTGWWRAAPMPDVMVDNTRENADDRRRSDMVQNVCSTGGC